jgi:hypothetical protein
VKFKFTNSGSGEDKTLSLSEGNVKLILTNLLIQEPCDFDNNLELKKSIEIPGDLSCNFLPVTLGKSEYYGTIDVMYDYSYGFLKSETFTVYPK